MRAQFWFAAVTTFVVVAFAVRSVVAESRFVRAQHRAYRHWDRTGRVVPGWSHHWKWSHPKDVEVSPGVTTSVNQFFTTIVQVVNVTHVHVRALVLPGLITRGTGDGAGGPSAAPIHGRIVGELPASLTSAALPHSVRWGSVARAFTRSGGGSR
jgi:hypothetical protein